MLLERRMECDCAVERRQSTAGAPRAEDPPGLARLRFGTVAGLPGGTEVGVSRAADGAAGFQALKLNQEGTGGGAWTTGRPLRSLSNIAAVALRRWASGRECKPRQATPIHRSGSNAVSPLRSTGTGCILFPDRGAADP